MITALRRCLASEPSQQIFHIRSSECVKKKKKTVECEDTSREKKQLFEILCVVSLYIKFEFECVKSIQHCHSQSFFDLKLMLI